MPRPEKDRYYLGIADAVSKRGTCLRRNYGSVIVKDDKIVSTGYVGSPRGTTNCSDIGTCYREAHNIPRGTQYETCLARDTKVITNSGIYTIEELYNKRITMGTDVLSLNMDPDYGDYNSRWSDAIDVRRTQFAKTVLRVKIQSDKDETKTGYIDCTPDHLFVVNLGYDYMPYQFVPACELKKGDKLFQSHVIDTPMEIEYHDYVYDMAVPMYHNFAVIYVKTDDTSYYTFVHNCKSVHSEANAIIHAGRDNCIGATLYLFGREATTGEIIKNADCCAMCKRMIINAGISRVVIKDYDNSTDEFNYHEVDVQKDWVEKDDIVFGTVGY